MDTQREFEAEVLQARKEWSYNMCLRRQNWAFQEISLLGCLLFMGCCLLVLLLGGCGFVNGESDYVPYSAALQEHSSTEARRIETQVQGINNALLTANPQTPTEGALLSVLAMLQIGQLAPTQLNIIKPTTGYDVIDHNVSMVASFLTMGVSNYFTWDAVKELYKGGGNTFYGDVAADRGSFSSSEQHQTYSSGAVATQSPYSVDPAVVEPSPLPEGVE